MGRRLKQVLREGKVARVFGIGQLCHPKVVAIVAQSGMYDAVWLDQEHAGLTIEQIEQASLAAQAFGVDCFVRLTATDYASVMRPLEAGATGVMAAQVRTAEEARAIVRWALFDPLGVRGVNGTGIDGRFGTRPLLDYFREANEQTFMALQIENVEAVADVDYIAAVEGVDVLFVGPADLSQSLGIPGQWDHPDLWRAIERTAEACRRVGKHWAVLPVNLDFARRCVALDCRMLSLGFDVWALHHGIHSYRQTFEDFFRDL